MLKLHHPTCENRILLKCRTPTIGDLVQSLGQRQQEHRLRRKSRSTSSSSAALPASGGRRSDVAIGRAPQPMVTVAPLEFAIASPSRTLCE
jgi:hypothetical protein